MTDLRRVKDGLCIVSWRRPGDRGYVFVKGKVFHRLLWEQAYGPVPKGFVLDHLCRNRSCLNLAHLEVVTNVENVMRGASPLAFKARQTHCYRGHPLTADNIHIWRGRRHCLTCKRAYQGGVERPCSICSAMVKVTWKGRCHNCDMYFRRHGIERPSELFRARA